MSTSRRIAISKFFVLSSCPYGRKAGSEKCCYELTIVEGWPSERGNKGKAKEERAVYSLDSFLTYFSIYGRVEGLYR